MKHKEKVEGNIRFNAAAIYIIVGFACCLIVLYLYNIRGNIEGQKIEIEQYKNTLALTNKLVLKVSEIQSSGSLYITTKNKKYLNSYRDKMGEVVLIVDSIALSANKAVYQTGLLKLDSLLRKQLYVISELGSRLGETNPLDEINKKLKDYSPIIKRDSVLVTTVHYDTIVNAAPKVGFFKRLGRVFAPKKDSVIILSNKKVDTLNVIRPDTLTIITEVDSVVRIAGEGYYKNIQAIGAQVGSLAASDQKIMEQISALLLGMYKQTLNSILDAINESERIIERNYTYSIVGSGVALLLLFIFIALIVSGVNKARMARIALERVNALDKEIMESRHKLLLSVSHDLKTPLNSILGYLELKQNAGEDVKNVLSSGNYILSLWENLIEFSSIEQGKLKISSTTFRLYDFFENISGMCLPLASKKGIYFEWEYDFNKEVFVCCDALKLKQIVVNIISNGIKYTVKGGVKLSVSYADKMLLCKVSDTGAGIPDNYKDKIFTPFQRVEKNNGLAEGSGLGLFVVRELIGLLGGSVEMTSQVGVGSEFTITIPVETGEVKSISNGTKKITVIDDDDVLLSMTASMLKELGHDVVTVSKIEEIGECDVILTDMEMGSCSGIDVLKNISNIPVVIMTARGDFGAADAKELGFTAYLSKPFTLASLRDIFGEGMPEHLRPMFGDDIEYMREVLDVFKISTAQNAVLLTEALEQDDFATARGLCHKMLPMFAQLGYSDIAEIMRKVDSNRAGAYLQWQKDITDILGEIQRI